MKNEVYFWIAFVVIVLAVALYVRLYYQPQLDLQLTFANSSQPAVSLYPYQKLSVPMEISNTGSATATNMSVGVYVDGNLTTLYRVYLPGGKSEPITFNFTTSYAVGRHTVYVVIDPDKLYNIKNRQDTQLQFNFTELAPQAAAPNSSLPSNGIAGQTLLNSGYGGIIVGSYLSYNYSISAFNFGGPEPISSFLYPFLNLTASYDKEVSIASASYGNGTYAYSVWLQGYLTPNVVGIAASGQGRNITNYTEPYGGVSLVKLGRNFTLCSWYSGGWLKMLFYNGSSCLGMINSTYGTHIDYAPLYDKLVVPNGTLEANYSAVSGNELRTSALVVQDSGFVYESIWPEGTVKGVCQGLIDDVNGTPFCSTYLVPNFGTIGNVSVVRTSADVNDYNLSVVAITNTSDLLSQVSDNIGLINSFGIKGSAINFTSGINNTCVFGGYFQCSGMQLLNGTATFTVKNLLDSKVRLTGVGCDKAGAPVTVPLNTTLAVNASTTLSLKCYNDGVPLSGAYVSLALDLPINYTQGNLTTSVLGHGYIEVSG